MVTITIIITIITQQEDHILVFQPQSQYGGNEGRGRHHHLGRLKYVLLPFNVSQEILFGSGDWVSSSLLRLLSFSSKKSDITIRPG